MKLKNDNQYILIILFISFFLLKLTLKIINQNIKINRIILNDKDLIIIFCLFTIIYILLINYYVKKYKDLYKFMKFFIVGILNTVIDFSILNILSIKFKVFKGLGLILINSISFSSAVINSYFWNKYWVFENIVKPNKKEFAQFLIVSLGGIIINNSIMYILTTEINYLAPSLLQINLAKIFATAFQLLWNFTFYKIIFKSKIST